MSKVVLVQFPPAFGLPNASPFCVKLEAWMRLQEIEYEVRNESNPARGPKGKIPFIEHEGQAIGDSSLILEYLKHVFGKDPDAHLTPRERADALAWQRVCDDHLYWVIVYSRWLDPTGWARMKRAFERLPIPLRWFVPMLARRKVRGQLHAQGLGRHSPEEIYRMGSDDIEALAARVEGEGFLYGEDPVTADTVVFSTVINVIWTPIENPMVGRARALPSLDAYCRRMWERCFPHLELPAVARGSQPSA